MSSSSPEAKPAQPKDAQDQSGAKDIVPSSGEQEKKADNGATATANVEASAPVTSSKVAPVSTPPLSEKPPILPSDSKPAPTSLDPEKGQDTAVPTTAVGVPFEPALRVPDTQERRRKRRLLIIHTRLARFFNWILLLGFVILPSTFSRDHQDNATQGTTGSPGSQAGGNGNTGSPLRHIYNVSLFAVGYSCCLINGLAISYLWYIRKDDHQWLLTNLFSAGLINSFSGLITTFVNYCGVQGGHIGVSTKATLILTSCCTFIYAMLTVLYARKRQQARYRRGSRASSTMV